MSPEDARIQEARTEVQAARRLLLSPSAAALGRSIPHLERAAAGLKALQTAVRSGPGPRKPAQAGLYGLQQAVSRVAALLENAADFYIGWSRQVTTAACGYTRTGEPAMAPGRQTLSFEG